MINQYLDQIKEEFDKTIEHLKSELAKVHTGRASAGLIEDLKVDYYGGMTPLKSLANITITAPREFRLEVWDQNAVKPVADAITKASLGSLPQIEGQVIRISLPPMTGETREKMVKIIHSIVEDAKISLRNSREKIWGEVQKLEREGQIREDDKFKFKDKVQEIIDEYSRQVEQIGGRKEEEMKG